MDLLTIDTSILGLLKATALVARYLAPYVSAARDTPKIVSQVHSEVVYTRTILIAIESLTNDLASIPARRAALITIDQLIAVFTDGVLLLSELEATLPSLPSAETTSPRLPLQSRLQWARKESVFVAFFTRLQGFKASISLMLNILQRQVFFIEGQSHFDNPANFNSDSDLRAAEHQQELSQNVAALLESNHSLTRRLMNLEDAFEVRSLVSKRQSRSFNTYHGISEGNSIGEEPNIKSTDSTIARTNNTSQLSTPPDRKEVSDFDFENDLGASRVYRRAQRDTMDFSFRSSIAHTNAWSIFSGLSLSDISIISAIALPLYPEEIENAQHYGLAGPQIVLDTTPTSHSPRVRSLYQECVEVELRLTKIPGFLEIFAKLRDEGEDHDPLSLLITFFRRGVPLLMLLERVPGLGNLDYLTELWYIDSQKLPKVATYKFIEACIHDLGFQPDECFSIGDLMGSNSTGFVNVRVIFSVRYRCYGSDCII
jgi:cell division control protein 24